MRRWSAGKGSNDNDKMRIGWTKEYEYKRVKYENERDKRDK
jgi:hypothetical protein